MLLESSRGAVRRGAALTTLVAALAATLLLAVGPLTGSGGTGDAMTAEPSPAVDSNAAPAGAGEHVRRAGKLAGAEGADRQRRRWPDPRYRDSVPVGAPVSGRLVRGVRFPREGRHFFTWDPVERESPNRPWRRWGTDHLVRTVLDVLAEHRGAHPAAPRLGVGDLSRPHGGDFGPQYGIVGHASHQNGLDVDVYYPLKSGRERAPRSVEEVNLPLSQDLVDRFVAAGAERVFVGPSTGLTGPPEVVQAIPYHDNHLHVRLPPRG